MPLPAATSAMSCSRQNSTASWETLVPAIISDWCIHTRETPASGHWRTICSVSNLRSGADQRGGVHEIGVFGIEDGPDGFCVVQAGQFETRDELGHSCIPWAVSVR